MFPSLLDRNHVEPSPATTIGKTSSSRGCASSREQTLCANPSQTHLTEGSILGPMKCGKCHHLPGIVRCQGGEGVPWLRLRSSGGLAVQQVRGNRPPPLPRVPLTRASAAKRARAIGWAWARSTRWLFSRARGTGEAWTLGAPSGARQRRTEHLAGRDPPVDERCQPARPPVPEGEDRYQGRRRSRWPRRSPLHGRSSRQSGVALRPAGPLRGRSARERSEDPWKCVRSAVPGLGQPSSDSWRETSGGAGRLGHHPVTTGAPSRSGTPCGGAKSR